MTQARQRTMTQQGMTLIEVLVALVISLLIGIASISALAVARQGFTTVDASSQLRDNARFSADLISRIALQAGYKDRAYAFQPASASDMALNATPNVSGYNNALISSSDPINSSTARTSSVAGYGSDVLILMHQNTESYAGSGLPDGSMIDCMGNSSTAGVDLPSDRYDRVTSVLHVDVSQGETSLMCTTQKKSTGLWSTQPIVQGVENFQVLYGTDNVIANTAPTAPNTAVPCPGCTSVPNRYLRADQMVVSGDSVATNNNWRRVRSIRIGMVLRGTLNSQQERVSQTFYPFGAAKASNAGAVGSALSGSADIGTVFTPTVDGRLRQTLSFTVHLRNDQGP